MLQHDNAQFNSVVTILSSTSQISMSKWNINQNNGIIGIISKLFRCLTDVCSKSENINSFSLQDGSCVAFCYRKHDATVFNGNSL